MKPERPLLKKQVFGDDAGGSGSPVVPLPSSRLSGVGAGQYQLTNDRRRSNLGVIIPPRQ